MFRFLEQNAVFIFMIMALVLIVEVALVLLPQNRGTKAVRLNGVLGELSEHADTIYILFEKSTRKVAFVSKNIGNILGIEDSFIYADIYALGTLIEKEEQHRIRTDIGEHLESGEKLTKELSIRRLNGTEELYMKLTLQSIPDDRYALLSLYDISEEERVRENLRRRIQEVQEIDESKTIFLSKMSHEIRTPMNGMLGMISLAKISQKQDKKEEASEYLEKAEGLTQFLLSIINDILDMSRIESGKLELESARFAIADVAEKIRTMFDTTISGKGIHFSVELLDFTIKYVVGDELRITQVITNFLSNASKFTESGGHISLIFREMKKQDDTVTIMIKVKDNGIGMKPEFLQRIFVPFEQEDSGIARKYGGSGLGMAISDSLVHEMGGQILVDSEEGKGTEFTVFLDLPIAQGSQTEQEVQQHAEISLEGIRVMMAEDNDVNALIATKLLEHNGMIVERVENGSKALDAYVEHEPGYYDAILMDIHMPVMDGWQATQEIRKVDRGDALTIPIIALSADAFVEDKRHSSKVGMNGHVTKPIDLKELQQTLRDCLAEVNRKR